MKIDVFGSLNPLALPFLSSLDVLFQVVLYGNVVHISIHFSVVWEVEIYMYLYVYTCIIIHVHACVSYIHVHVSVRIGVFHMHTRVCQLLGSLPMQMNCAIKIEWIKLFGMIQLCT